MPTLELPGPWQISFAELPSGCVRTLSLICKQFRVSENVPRGWVFAVP
jgi:hypothetical protein